MKSIESPCPYVYMVGNMPNVFEKQLYSYLKHTNYKVGILVNFGADKLEIKQRIYG